MSTTEQKPIAEMTKDELHAELESAGVSAPAALKKELLVMLVASARQPAEDVEVEEVSEPASPEVAKEEEGEQQVVIDAEATLEADEVVEPTAEIREAESQALALRDQPVVVAPALLPSAPEFHAMREMAAAIASTQMVPTAYRGKPDDVLAAILTGREMNLGPMQSLREIYVIDGKPSLSTNLLLARLLEGGVVIEESESTNERAWVRARRRDTGATMEVEWTMEEAMGIVSKGKKLVEKDNWRNYPKDMLWARLVGRLARQFGPDLIGSAMPYTSEEVQDWDDEQPSDEERRAKFGGDKKTGTWHGPTGWKELSDRLLDRLGAGAADWLHELAELYGFDSLSAVLHSDEIPQERKEDLWRRLNTTLRVLEDTVDTRSMPPQENLNELIREAFGKGFDGHQLAGPQTEQEQAAAASREATPEERDNQHVAGGESDSPAADESVEPEATEPDADAVAAAEEPGTGEDEDLPAF